MSRIISTPSSAAVSTSNRRGARCLAWVPVFLVVGGLSLFAVAPARAAEADEKEKVEIPEPEVISLTTKDNLNLKATFYGGTKGKESVPIVILHDYEGNRNQFDGLARSLQSLGHAVLVPDLRGHGESTQYRTFGGRGGGELDASRFRRGDFANIRLDLAAVRHFLVEKNNAEELNLNKLCVIGAGMGATMALNWALVDWSWPPLATGKQGQDIKGLVLLSPETNFKGITVEKALQHPALRSKVSVLLMVGGGNRSAAREADRIFQRLEPYHKAERPEDKDLFQLELNTSLQGTRLITARGLRVPATIAQFIEFRLVRQDYPWLDRMTTR
jgi:pimeloyl-ACP methyl ester carboxylesterase